MPLFRRKAEVPIDAEQYFGVNVALPRGVATDDEGRAFVRTRSGYKFYVTPGDWIVKSDDGEFSVVADMVIRRCFEPIPESHHAQASSGPAADLGSVEGGQSATGVAQPQAAG